MRFLIIAGLLVAGISISSDGALLAQNPEMAVLPPVTFTADQDHQNMMDQLGSFMATVDANRVFTLLGAKGPDVAGRLPHGEDASCESGPAGWTDRVERARRRTHGRTEHEVLY